MSGSALSSLPEWMAHWQPRVEAALDEAVPAETEMPSTLHRAMRHSLFAGGKRLRPLIVLAACETAGGDPARAMDAACAVELLHTYSLVHDDLPCMDDDDLRRGKPTCHKVFGDAVAVLAGDALQALAFERVALTRPSSPWTSQDLVLDLARAAGSRKLVGGQVLDLEGEGRDITTEELRAIHVGKTAALLTSCLRLGGMTAGATPESIEALEQFGMATGLAFQVIDDILDLTQTDQALGKTAGKDAAAGKATYPALMGLDASRQEAVRLTREAHDALETFGENGWLLRAIANHLLARDF